jgi:signal transduction histidine kinase/ActR/RegA family two-component response regulator
LVQSPLDDSRAGRVCRGVSIAAAVYAIVGGAVGFSGWALDLPRLTDWNNEGISMFPNTALCAALSGTALLLLVSKKQSSRSRTMSRALAAFVATIGGLTLLEHITDVNFGIDTLLFDKAWGQKASAAPMRMGPPASVSFLILGAALLLAQLRGESRRFASELALLVVAIASLSLIGYWFGADKLFGVARTTGIALQTSTMLAALGLGLMAAVPEHGIVASLRRDDAGGTVMRRLILPIIVVPLVLGWVRILGQQAGLYDMAFGTAIRTLIEVILLIALLWWTASGISRHALAARRAEQALRESEESLKQADRRKDEFLATLAHELRNPLAPIGNALEIIKHADGNSEMMHVARDTMHRQFGQMVRLVDDLLDVGRITRDRLELRQERVELATVIHQAIDTCRAMAEAAGHKIGVSLPTTPIWVFADPVRLTQVFSNLLNNGCKFTEPGGSISISTQREGDEVLVSVTDSGVGIAPGELDRIFEIFEQVDRTLERTRGGLGIGLTIVKRLVELHGGEIAVKSDGHGAGSTFVVRLPTVAAEVPAPASNQTPSATPALRRVLVVDDNRDSADSLALLLKVNGHDVQTAYDGREAVDKIQAVRPDLVLLDIGMPGMNGHDVCRFVRQQPWGHDIRIAALTGWGQDQDRELTRASGFDHHLVKPVQIDELNSVLHSTPQFDRGMRA